MFNQMFNYLRSLLIVGLLFGNPVALHFPAPARSNLQPFLQQMAVEEPASQARVIVQTTADRDSIQNIVQRLEGKVVYDFSFIHAFTVELPAKALPTLAATPGIHWISLDAPVHSTSINDGSADNAHDDFNTLRFDESSGGHPWLSAWQEEGEIDGPQLGDVAVTDFFGGALQGLRIQNGGRGAYRLVDLTNATSATLTLAYRRKDFSAQDAVAIQISMDGGNSWIDLAQFTGPNTDAEIQYAHYTITDYIAPQTGVRLISNAEFSESAKFYLDSIDIDSNFSIPDMSDAPNKLYLPMIASADSATGATNGAKAFDKQSVLQSTDVTAAAVCDYVYCFDLTKLLSNYDRAIGVDQIWNVSPYRRGWYVGVAVVDSGVTAHPDLTDYGNSSRISVQMQFGGAAGTVDDYYGHGTHIAGIIGGLGSRSNGSYVGVAPESKIIDVKVINDYGYGTTSDVVAGLQWIYNNRELYNIRVANLSLNSTVPESYHTSPLDAALEILWFNQITVVVSAGNKGSQHLYPPANDPFAITVGALDDKGTTSTSDDTLATYSAFGITESGFSKPDLLAPGSNIVQALSSDDSNLARDHGSNKVLASTGYNYFKMSGTSMAAAVVSGAVAVLLEDEPNLTPDQIKYRFKATARPISSGYACSTGAGALNLYAAINGTTTQNANSNIQASQLLWSGSNPITWGSVNWNSVNWNSVNWNSVNWNSVNWNSVNWNNSVWDSGIWDTTTQNSSSSTCMGVTSLTLINAGTDKDLQPLFPGAILDARVISGTANLTVRANVVGTHESVSFNLDNGAYSKMENKVPYTLVGNNNSDFLGMALTMGNHTLKASPYTLDNGAGAAGNPISVSFRMATSLQAVVSNRCMAVSGGSLADSTQIIQSDCIGKREQLFELRAVAGKTNRYTVVNTNSEKCLDVSGGSTADNANLIQHTCHGGLNQEFELRTVTGAGANVYNLAASHSGKCVNVMNGSTTNGTNLVQWTCNGSQSQRWRLGK